MWRACILVRAWRVKASFYLLNSFVSLPLPKEITCTKWSVSTKGTLSRRTPNLLLKLPKIWPKSMWNNCNQNKMQFQKLQFEIGAESVKILGKNCKLPPTNNESSCWRQCIKNPTTTHFRQSSSVNVPVLYSSPWCYRCACHPPPEHMWPHSTPHRRAWNGVQLRTVYMGDIKTQILNFT